MPTEEIRRRVGDAAGGSGALRRDVGLIRFGRAERISEMGFERLFLCCEAFGIDPVEAMQPAAPRGRLQ